MPNNSSGGSVSNSIDTAYAGDGSQAPMAFARNESGLSPTSTSPPPRTQRAEMKKSPTGSTDTMLSPTLGVVPAGGEGSFSMSWFDPFVPQDPAHLGFAHHPLPLVLLDSPFDPRHQQPSGIPSDVAHPIPNAAPAHMWPRCLSPSQAFHSSDPQTTAPPTTSHPYGSHESFSPDPDPATLEHANLGGGWDGMPIYSDDMQFQLAESGRDFHVQRRYSVDSDAATLYSADSPPMEPESGIDQKPPGSHDMQRSYSDSAVVTSIAAREVTLSSSLSPPARPLRKLPTRDRPSKATSSSSSATAAAILAPAATLPAGSVPVPSALQERSWQNWAPWINSLPDDDLKALETRQLHPLRYSPGMTQAQRDLTDLANERMMAAKNFKRRQINNAAAARSRARKNEALDAARRDADDQARRCDEAAAEAAGLRGRLATAEAALEVAKADNEALRAELAKMGGSKM
ncbi:hypothetical protein RB595_006374 [Gaeumannomyces hyphopodioides]